MRARSISARTAGTLEQSTAPDDQESHHSGLRSADAAIRARTLLLPEIVAAIADVRGQELSVRAPLNGLCEATEYWICVGHDYGIRRLVRRQAKWRLQSDDCCVRRVIHS
jgi:hypothetical protein